MKLSLLGYGKMGKLIEKIALSRGFSITSKLNRQEQNWDRIIPAETWIDFSDAALVQGHIEKAIEHKKNLLIGTTGYTIDFDTLNERVDGHAILLAPNCSIGMLLYMKILERAASVMKPFSDYEIGGFEVHHREKKDAPSGTAKAISNSLESILDKKIPFASQRLGYHPGEHQVTFDSPIDSITLTHSAKSREGFARGALAAAEWMQEKSGLFTIDDYIKGVLDGA